MDLTLDSNHSTWVEHSVSYLMAPSRPMKHNRYCAAPANSHEIACSVRFCLCSSHPRGWRGSHVNRHDPNHFGALVEKCSDSADRLHRGGHLAVASLDKRAEICEEKEIYHLNDNSLVANVCTPFSTHIRSDGERILILSTIFDLDPS